MIRGSGDVRSFTNLKYVASVTSRMANNATENPSVEDLQCVDLRRDLRSDFN